jgi:hypothetical protein
MMESEPARDTIRWKAVWRFARDKFSSTIYLYRRGALVLSVPSLLRHLLLTSDFPLGRLYVCIQD